VHERVLTAKVIVCEGTNRQFRQRCCERRREAKARRNCSQQARRKPVASEDVSNRVQARLCIVYTQVLPAKFDRARTSLMHDIFASTQFRHPPGLHATVTRPALSSAVVSRAS
jgi:hypothetical protein